VNVSIWKPALMFHNILWRCAWDVGGICWLIRVEFAGKWILKISHLGYAEKKRQMSPVWRFYFTCKPQICKIEP